MARLNVFVSHRTVEAKFADTLRRHLSRDFIGIIKFFISTDVTSVPAGSQWYAQLISKLQDADMLLALCSNEAVGQPWINYEAGGACARGVDLIPLCYGGMTPDRLPVPLAMSESSPSATNPSSASNLSWSGRVSKVRGAGRTRTAERRPGAAGPR